MTVQNQYFPQSRPHPGETLAEKLDEMKMGPKEFAVRTGKPEKTIIAVLNGESSITPDMAVQFENATKIPASFWMNHQRAYDEYLARRNQLQRIEKAVEWARRFPLADMIKKGWLPPVATAQEKTAALLSFFGFSDHDGWEDYYFRQQLKVAFRISLAQAKHPYALSAWLRQGELQAAQLESEPYSPQEFKLALPQIKSLMAKHPGDFFSQLQSICLRVGVKVVYTPCVQKAPASGCARWINDTPVIQLSARYKRNDSFWFTFFHEAGHIILHGKKDIFLENAEGVDTDKQKEEEADNFAVRWTLTQQEESQIEAENLLTDEKILAFARRFDTHPAIIVGRLQHRKILSFARGKSFIVPVDLG